MSEAWIGGFTETSEERIGGFTETILASLTLVSFRTGGLIGVNGWRTFDGSGGLENPSLDVSRFMIGATNRVVGVGVSSPLQ